MLDYHSGKVAQIVTSKDGGPLRRIINGRARHPTGFFVSRKANGRAMPWESFRCELPVLELAEVGSPVIELLAQPHRLEILAKGHARPLRYFPDLLLKVEDSFARRLASGEPFAAAITKWKPQGTRRGQMREVIVEVKDDDDSRLDDEEYQTKLKLAKSVYKGIGKIFIQVKRSRDIECADLGTVRSVALSRFTSISSADIDCAIRCCSCGPSVAYAQLVHDLGGGALGKAKAAALHVRRVVCIDISCPLGAATTVQLMCGQPDTGRSQDAA